MSRITDIWQRKPAGLVLGLDFSGGRVTSPTGHTGTLVGNATVAAGTRYLALDGSGDWLRFNDADEFSATAGGGVDRAMSWMGWVRYTANSGNQGLFGKIGGAAAGQWEYFAMARQSATGPRFSLYGGNSTPTIGRYQATATAASTGVFYHYAFTYSGNEASSGIKIYLNSVRVDDTDANAGIYTGTVNAGGFLYVGSQDAYSAINGGVADIRIYNRELTQPEIAQIYNAGAARIALGGTP